MWRKGFKKCWEVSENDIDKMGLVSKCPNPDKRLITISSENKREW